MMNTVPTPLSKTLLDLATAFAGPSPHSDVIAPVLAPLDAAGWFVEGYRILETELGREFRLRVPQAGDAEIPVPALPQLAFVVRGANAQNELTALWSPDGQHLELRGLRLGVRVAPALLRPLDPGTAPEIVFEGAIRLGSDWSLELVYDQELSLPPSEIVGTGIEVALQGVRVDLRSDYSPPPVLALGHDKAFRGVYVREGSLRLFPGLLFGAEKGLSLAFRDAAVGPSGLTCRVERFWTLEHDGTDVSATSEMAGQLLGPGMPVALGFVEADVFNNLPRAVRALGVVRVPVLDLLFDAEFAMRLRPGAAGYGYGLRVGSLGPGEIDVGVGQVGYESISLEGTLDEETFEASGTVMGLEVDVPPIELGVASAAVAFARDVDGDNLRLSLKDVELGPLGTLEFVDLVVERRRDEAGTSATVYLESVLSWQDLQSRIALPSQFPAPPDDAEIRVRIEWRDDAETGQRTMLLRLAAEASGVDNLWAFVPQAYRPRVHEASLVLEISYSSVADFSAGTTSEALSGALAAELVLELPDLQTIPGSEWLTVRAGGEEGAVRASLRLEIGAPGVTSVRLGLQDLVTVEIELPGLPQPEPPIHLELTDMEFDLEDGEDVEGKLKLSGEFELRPISPPATVPIAAHLQRLLAPIEPGLLSGAAELELRFEDDRAQLELSCDFADASVEVDVFDVVSSLSRGLAAPPGVPEPAGEIDLDMDVGFSLRHLGMRLGSLEEIDPSVVAVELGMGVNLAGLEVEGHLRLSEGQLAIGVTQMRVPMRMPRFPLTRAEVEALQTNADWNAKLEGLREGVEALEGLPETEASRRELGRLRARLGVLEYLWKIRESLPDRSRVPAYQDALATVLGILDAAAGVTRFDSDVELVLRDVEFVIPFSDPRGIRLEGGARLEGFAPEDPFAGLEGVELGLGLSAERIFFSVDSLGQPIPLPDFGRYPGGTVDLSQLTLGYGYTKNSFSMTFGGELVLPPQLVEDAETSRELGAGVRLPSQTRLGFKLDLVPVPGPIPLVPLIEFDLDLRSPDSPALAGGEGCEPFWDGLQMIVPGLYRSDVKQIAASPVLGILPIANARFDGDLMLGNEKNGLTVILDNFLFLAGLSTPPIPIPFLADPTQPYFDNFCVNLRLAGFGVNFNLQRPFPGLSPLALFEALGLLADPTMPIDPQGALANSLRVTVADARITLPPEVQRLFPQAGSHTRKEVNVTINLGTFLVGLQGAAKAGGQIAEAVEDGDRSLSRRLEDLARTPPELDLGAVLEAVPPELRKVALGASFAGFEARAVLLLIDASDQARLVSEFARRGTPASPTALPPLGLGLTPDPEILSRFRPNVGGSPGDGRTYYPDEPHNSLFAGEDFAGFEAGDLVDIPAPHKPMAGVVVGANVRVFGDQRFRFLGSVFEDGSFGMVSALDVEPMNLKIAGIDIKLPLELHGRLVLQGRANREGVTGSVRAQVQGTWRVIENVLALSVGPTEPVGLELHSDGKFALKGEVLVKMFNNDAATLLGTVDASDTHCLVSGTFRYLVGSAASPAVDLRLSGGGRIGPQRRFSISGEGSLSLFGMPLTKVSGKVSESGAEIEASLDTGPAGRWFVGQDFLDNCRLQLALAGRIDLRKTDYPEFDLAGRGELELFGAKVEGSAAIASRGGKISTAVEGRLTWQKREWLNGRVLLDSDGLVNIAGRTSFALALTPTDLPYGIKVAGLFLKVDVGGSFGLDPQGGMASYDLKIDWVLAARLPNAPKQTFPLAMQNFEAKGGTALNMQLVHIPAIDLLPLGEAKIPVLKMDVASWATIGTVPLDIDNRLKMLYMEAENFMLPHKDWWIDETQKSPLAAIPVGLKWWFEDEAIPLSMRLSEQFTVSLSWQNSQLGIVVDRGGVKSFIAFESAFS